MGYAKRGGKETADGLPSIDVNWLNRRGLLHPGILSSVCWTHGDRITDSISIRAEDGESVLMCRHSCRGSEGEDVKEYVRLTWTPCNFGGKRPWFVCLGAGCGRRVGKLFAAGKYFLCRHCYDLAYDSQREDEMNRQLRKAQKIRRRLGCSESLAVPILTKPKHASSGCVTRQRKRTCRCGKASALWRRRSGGFGGGLSSPSAPGTCMSSNCTIILRPIHSSGSRTTA